MCVITVVVSLYNKQHHVGECIKSILNQTFKDFDLVIVNDGSTDGSKAVVNKFTDQRIKIIDQINAGPGPARNRGLQVTTSPFVTFIDADDYWHPQFLAQAVQDLGKYPESDVWLCGTVWEPPGEQRPPFIPNDKASFKEGEWRLSTEYTAYETYDVLNLFATGAVIAKTDIIKKYGGYFDKKKCTSGEDGYLWLQVMYNTTIYRCNQYLTTINTLGSELGINRKNLKPVPPWLTHSKEILNNCPAKYHRSLSEYLNYTGFLSFRREIYQAHIWNGVKLLIQFPGLYRFKNKEYPPIFLAVIIYPIKHLLRVIYNKFK